MAAYEIIDNGLRAYIRRVEGDHLCDVYRVPTAELPDLMTALRDHGVEPIHQLTCAECGTTEAETYMVTGALADREGRTEVCLACTQREIDPIITP